LFFNLDRNSLVKTTGSQLMLNHAVCWIHSKIVG
jgi:hypothetical protein